MNLASEEVKIGCKPILPAGSNCEAQHKVGWRRVIKCRARSPQRAGHKVGWRREIKCRARSPQRAGRGTKQRSFPTIQNCDVQDKVGCTAV